MKASLSVLISVSSSIWTLQVPIILGMWIFGFAARTTSAEIISGMATPVPDAAVFAIFADGASGDLIGQLHGSTTGEDGNFSFVVTPGLWGLRLDHREAGRRGLLSPVRFVEVTPGKDVSGLRLELVRPSITLPGILRNDLDSPIGGASVTGEITTEGGTYSVTVPTDAQGGFSLNVFPGPWVFFVWNLPDGVQSPGSQRLSLTEDSVAEGVSLTFIASTQPPGLEIIQSILPGGTAGEPYSTTLTATGGGQPFSWKVAEGSQLPPQLKLKEFTGELEGILTQSGQHRFTIEVSQFVGSRSGRKTLTLPVGEDETHPRLLRTNPPSIANLIRDNSAVAIRFNEPMSKIGLPGTDRDRVAFSWMLPDGTVLGPGDLLFDWNASGDTLFVAHPDPLPLGSHRWTLNPPGFPPDDPNTEEVERPLLLQDASGNRLTVPYDLRFFALLTPDGLPSFDAGAIAFAKIFPYQLSLLSVEGVGALPSVGRRHVVFAAIGIDGNGAPIYRARVFGSAGEPFEADHQQITGHPAFAQVQDLLGGETSLENVHFSAGESNAFQEAIFSIVGHYPFAIRVFDENGDFTEAHHQPNSNHAKFSELQTLLGTDPFPGGVALDDRQKHDFREAIFELAGHVPFLSQVFPIEFSSERGGAGTLPSRWRDLENVLLIKEQIVTQEGLETTFEFSHFMATLNMPRYTWNTVARASFTRPDQERFDVPYFGTYGGTTLHFNDGFFRLSDLQSKFPDGSYRLDIETFHDGRLSLNLDLQAGTFADPALFDETQHLAVIRPDRNLVLKYADDTAGDADLIHLIINDTSARKLYHLRETLGDVIEFISQPEGEPLVVPPGTFKPNTEYFATIRKLKFTDRNGSYPGAQVLAVQSTVTEFSLHTGDAGAPLPTAVAINEFILAFENRTVSGGESLPDRFSVETGAGETARINIRPPGPGDGGEVALEPGSRVSLDLSLTDFDFVTVQLDRGGLNLTVSGRLATQPGLQIFTPDAVIVACAGTLRIVHDEDTETTTVSVSGGRALVRDRAPDGRWSILKAGSSGAYPSELVRWRKLLGLALDGSDDLASPSGDTLENLLKFAFNMVSSPGDLLRPNVTELAAGGDSGLPRIGPDHTGGLCIEFIRLRASENPGIVYTVETGSELTSLLPLSLTDAVVSPVDARWERVKVTDPSGGARLFARVRVTR